ncbi:16S rRNA (guanine(966)-N(2))-methyltransferase RsmD [Magnetovibrio sp. PR-2]|uniref:16S rRNA (guanine(966)-N(2))-methyltransferase RsmD n=1 Tax=Magnetovibrio sp. PR-2 TaxID=3120356 RepID=UPI002FCE04A5
MRIVGGKHKGRPLDAPKGRDTRPTSDRAREAMFNVLAHLPDAPGLHGAHVIDVFAGTGALGLEALSRGAAFATFVENHRAAQKTIQANIQTLDEGAQTQLLPIKAQTLPPAQTPVDYAFLDAPYEKNLTVPALETLIGQDWLKPAAIVMVEIAAEEDFVAPDQLTVIKDKTYGAAKVLFLRNCSDTL